MKKIYILKTEEEIESAFSIMKELRPHLNLEEYKAIYEDSHKSDNYKIAALEFEGQIVAIMGFRFLSDFVRGRHLYIDDLVTSEKIRSKGFGVELLKFAEEIAAEASCNILRLCTGIENDRGIKFYEKNGWSKRAYAYTKKTSAKNDT